MGNCQDELVLGKPVYFLIANKKIAWQGTNSDLNKATYRLTIKGLSAVIIFKKITELSTMLLRIGISSLKLRSRKV